MTYRAILFYTFSRPNFKSDTQNEASQSKHNTFKGVNYFIFAKNNNFSNCAIGHLSRMRDKGGGGAHSSNEELDFNSQFTL